MYHEVPYDFRSDWPAECQDIRCLSLQGEYEELATLWEFLRKKQAHEVAFPLMKHGSRLGVHRGAGLNLSGSVGMKCLTVLQIYCVFSSLSAQQYKVVLVEPSGA